ncbi:MAG: hypothetical protein Q4A07_00410 [Coriobacteriales bacterium]|nr:hypothetical protein [Coriobacteriales bacterium]
MAKKATRVGRTVEKALTDGAVARQVREVARQTEQDATRAKRASEAALAAWRQVRRLNALAKELTRESENAWKACYCAMQQSTWAESCQHWSEEYALYAENGIRPRRMLEKAKGYSEGARLEADEAEVAAREVCEAADEAMQVATRIFSLMASKMGIATEEDAAIQTISVAAMRTAHYLVVHDGRPRAAFLDVDDALLFMSELADVDAVHEDIDAACEVVDRSGNRLGGYRVRGGEVTLYPIPGE